MVPHSPSSARDKLSKLLCTTALATTVLISGGTAPTQAVAQEACAPEGGTYYLHEEIGSPIDEEITRAIDICYERLSGQTRAHGIDSRDWSGENALIVRGTIDVRSNASDDQTAGDAYADARGIYTSDWGGDSNLLINESQITASARGGVNSGAGVTKSFGIYTENWDGVDNALLNFGNISTSVSGGSGPNANEAHGIRMGEWNGEYSYFENWGNIELSGEGADGSLGSGAGVVSGFISNQGMNAEWNVLLNYGDLTGEVYGGDDAANGTSIGILRGINLSNYASTGANIYVGNWGDMTIHAQGGDDAGGDSYTDAAGIVFKAVGESTENFAIENYGNIDLTSISGTNSEGFNNAFAYGLRTNNLDASELAIIANYGEIKAHAADDSSDATRSYGIAFGATNENAYIVNTGNIEVTADSVNGRAVGIGTFGLNGAFNGLVYNTGKIVARGTGGSEGYAIYLGPSSVEPEAVLSSDGNVPSVYLSTQGFLEGQIVVGGQALIIDNNNESGSVHWTVRDDTVEGDPNWTKLDNVFYSVEGLSAATFDTSMASAQSAIIGAAASAGLAHEAGLDTTGDWDVWGTVVGGNLDTDGSERGTLDTSTDYGGIVGGVAGQLNGSNLALSLSLGGVRGDTSIESQWMNSYESTSDTIFAGASATYAAGPLKTTFGIRGGATNFDHTRSINNNLTEGGIDTVSADQDTSWLQLSGGAEYALLQEDSQTATAFARVSHLIINQEGYSESGPDGAATATVGDLETTNTRAEAGLKLSQATETGSLTGMISLFGTQEGGDDALSVSMLGDNRSISIASRDDFGFAFGLGYEAAIMETATLTAGLNLETTRDGDRTASLNLGISYQF